MSSLDGEDIRLMLWDTAGQEEFDCITRAYYRGAQACVLAFSCVDRESFKCVPKWKKKVEEECGNIPMVLVMTKLDLLYRAEVDSFEVEKLSRQLGIRLIKTSVKENINVHKVKCQVSGQCKVQGVSCMCKVLVQGVRRTCRVQVLGVRCECKVQV